MCFRVIMNAKITIPEYNLTNVIYEDSIHILHAIYKHSIYIYLAIFNGSKVTRIKQ